MIERKPKISLIFHLFLAIDITMKKTIFLREVYNRKISTSFVNLDILGTSRAIFQRYHQGIFYLFAMQNHCRLSILDCVEPDALEGTFQNGKFGVFIALLDKLNFGTNEFIITEILNKT